VVCGSSTRFNEDETHRVEIQIADRGKECANRSARAANPSLSKQAGMPRR